MDYGVCPGWIAVWSDTTIQLCYSLNWLVHRLSCYWALKDLESALYDREVSKSSWNHQDVREPETSILICDLYKTSFLSHCACHIVILHSDYLK